MLDGFVVPHAHFRVFHGNAAAESTCRASADPLALTLAPKRAETIPTDLHLREFAQLEAQVKALQQQQQQQPAAAHPTSRLVAVAQSASLVECFSFYARLLTTESFTWPDFLTIVCAKLTEHFVASELVRNSILNVFRGGRAHVARVTDASKISTLIKGILNQHGDSSSTTVWALQLVETMPSLVKDDASIRASVLGSLRAKDASEQRAAVAAARVMLPLSTELRRAVFALVGSSNAVALVPLMPRAFEEEDHQGIEQAWNFCASLFHDQVRDEDALQCLYAAGEIVAKYPDYIVAQHLQLVRYIVAKDPRPTVVAKVWSTCEEAIAQISEPSTQATFFDIILLQLRSDAAKAVHASAIRALDCFSQQAPVPAEVVTRARTIASATPHHQRLFIQLLSHCARWELVGNEGRDEGPHEPHGLQRTMYLNELIQSLKPGRFIRDRRVLVATVTVLKDLVSEFPDQIGSYVGEGYLQLVRLARRKQLEQMEAALWLSLSYVSVHCPHVIAQNAELLLSDSVLTLGSKPKQAIAVCLVNASQSCSTEVQDVWLAQCLRLTMDSDNDRYTVARVAMCRGAFRFAGRLLNPIADTLDNDVYGSWLRALIAISEAGDIVGSEALVTMGAHHQLAQGKAFLQAVASPQCAFNFHLAFITARIKWMELMLQAQQLAGEIAHSRRPGGYRVHRLGESFRANAKEFLAIRSKMLCASSSDRDVLLYHAQISSVIADAVGEFFVQDGIKSTPPCNDLTGVAPASAVPSSSLLVSRFRDLSTLQADIHDKARRLAALDAVRRPLVGSAIFTQLLRALCTHPSLLPRQFFRSQARPNDRVRCNLQFLTQSEVTSTSTKPRSRSQLGVALGSEFTSSLHGAVAFPQKSSMYAKASALQVTVTLVMEKAEAGVTEGTTTQHVSEVRLRLAKPEAIGNAEATAWTYVAVEAPIVVSSDLLKSKGTYTIHATAGLVDGDGEVWELVLTGGRRGIIVY